MSLTTQEIRAIQETANYWSSLGWGLAETGLCPAGVVAAGRGAVFVAKKYRGKKLWPADTASDQLAREALRDVANACQLTIHDYLVALNKEMAGILARLPGVSP